MNGSLRLPTKRVAKPTNLSWYTLNVHIDWFSLANSIATLFADYIHSVPTSPVENYTRRSIWIEYDCKIWTAFDCYRSWLPPVLYIKDERSQLGYYPSLMPMRCIHSIRFDAAFYIFLYIQEKYCKCNTLLSWIALRGCVGWWSGDLRSFESRLLTWVDTCACCIFAIFSAFDIDSYRSSIKYYNLWFFDTFFFCIGLVKHKVAKVCFSRDKKIAILLAFYFAREQYPKLFSYRFYLSEILFCQSILIWIDIE